MASLGVVNGTGASNFNVVDNNNFKDVYVTADYELDSDGSIVGMYGYIGQAPMTGLMTISIKLAMFNYFTSTWTLTGLLLSGRNTKMQV